MTRKKGTASEISTNDKTYFRILWVAYSMVDSRIRFSAKRSRTHVRWCWLKSLSNSFESSYITDTKHNELNMMKETIRAMKRVVRTSLVVGYMFNKSWLLAFKNDHDLFSTSVSMPHSSCIRLERFSDWSQYCNESLVMENKRKKANSLPSTGCVPTDSWNVNGPLSFSSAKYREHSSILALCNTL